MKVASSQVACPLGMLTHWISHCATGSLFLGISLQSNIASGATLIAPLASINGNPGVATA
jgi:hypothetical protein